MKKLIIVVALVFIATPAFAGEYHFTWDEDNTKLHYGVTAVLLVDMLQTLDNVDKGWPEINPILGEYPNKKEVYGYFAASYLVITALTYALPSKWSHMLQAGTITVELYQTSVNFRLGVGFSF